MAITIFLDITRLEFPVFANKNINQQRNNNHPMLEIENISLFSIE
jgi:hypothetical protein